MSLSDQLQWQWVPLPGVPGHASLGDLPETIPQSFVQPIKVASISLRVPTDLAPYWGLTLTMIGAPPIDRRCYQHDVVEFCRLLRVPVAIP